MIKLHWLDGFQQNFEDYLVDIPENKMEDYARSLIERFSGNMDTEIQTYSSILVNTFKALIAEGVLSYYNFHLYWNYGETIAVNKYGAIVKWPEGFADVMYRLAERTLTGAMKQKRDEKNVKTS